jgi:hypothetical protein
MGWSNYLEIVGELIGAAAGACCWKIAGRRKDWWEVQRMAHSAGPVHTNHTRQWFAAARIEKTDWCCTRLMATWYVRTVLGYQIRVASLNVESADLE